VASGLASFGCSLRHAQRAQSNPPGWAGTPSSAEAFCCGAQLQTSGPIFTMAVMQASGWQADAAGPPPLDSRRTVAVSACACWPDSTSSKNVPFDYTGQLLQLGEEHRAGL